MNNNIKKDKNGTLYTITTAQASAQTGVPRATITNWCKEKKLDCIMDGGIYKINREEYIKHISWLKHIKVLRDDQYFTVDELYAVLDGILLEAVNYYNFGVKEDLQIVKKKLDYIKRPEKRVSEQYDYLKSKLNRLDKRIENMESYLSTIVRKINAKELGFE